MSSRIRWSKLPAFLLLGSVCIASVALGHGGDADEHAPHYDAPHHGGLVLEFNEEVHYEIVLLPSGQLQIWFSDVHRRPLAAAEVTDVAVEVDHADKSVEPVDLHISNDGNFWTATVHLRTPADVVRVGFTYEQQPATGSIQYSRYLAAQKQAAQHQDTHDHQHEERHE